MTTGHIGDTVNKSEEDIRQLVRFERIYRQPSQIGDNRQPVRGRYKAISQI